MDLEARLRPALRAWLAGAERRQEIRGHTAAVYEPEEHRFGGSVGMAVAHDHWDRDTRLVLAYERLSAAERGPVGRHAVWAAGLHHLLRACLEDDTEVWDVWKRFEHAVGPPRAVAADASNSGGTPCLRLAAEVHELQPSFISRLGPRLAGILEQAIVDDERTAEALLWATQCGQLTVGLRAWLAAAAVFQANRWGVGLEVDQLASLTKEMTVLLQPDADWLEPPGRTRPEMYRERPNQGRETP